MSTTTFNIPLVDLRTQYRHLKTEIDAAVHAVFERADYILGEEVRLFEDEFARFCNSRFAIGCGSGTDALLLACKALGIGPGDEVIIPAFTFIATALAVMMVGAKPVLVDVQPNNALIDIRKLEAAKTLRTRAIIPVHLYGQCADMNPLLDWAKRQGLYVIEDAAQAHGAEYNGQRAGSFGDAGCFSFYPGKNLGAYGDGGLVVVQDEARASKLRLLRNWGSSRKYHHEEEGLNSRLDTVQAAILRVKLRYLEQWNEDRRSLAAQYSRVIKEIPSVQLTEYAKGSVFHCFVIRVNNRDEVLKQLQQEGIQAGIHYPFAIHELKACRQLGYPPGSFPVAEDWARRCLTLPIYPEMPAEAVCIAAGVLKGSTAEGPRHRSDKK